MAKFVIAGQADCPYYARAELLGDKLAINLPDFKLHKIVKTQDEWQSWLVQTCQTRGWRHEKSPLIWRELIDRGGKGVLIGGANEFQEYAQGYYGIESSLMSDNMQKIAAENEKCKSEIDQITAAFKAQSQPVHVCITNASSNICYNMIDSLCRGDIFGGDTELIIHLLDTPEKEEYLNGVKMEAEDLARGLLRGVVVENEVESAFRGCSYIVLLDDIQKGEKSKEEWIKENCVLFINYAKTIAAVADPSVKVLIAGFGPVNFNAYMMIRIAPTIPRQNIVALSRLVENHAKSVIGERLKVNTSGVVDMIVWGNPNGGHFIDLSRCRVHGYDGAIVGPDSFSLSSLEMVYDKKWLETEFLDLVKTKKSRTEEALNHTATLSIATAVNSTLKHWCQGSPSGQMFSLGVCSEGWYGVPQDLVFSFPVTFHPKGNWNVVQDIELFAEVNAKLLEAVKDIESEIEVIYPRPKPPTPEPADANNSALQTADKTEGAEQRLETIVEEKKETTSDEGEKTATDGEASASAGEATDTPKPAEESGEVTQTEDDKGEEQLPTE
ncbi:putative malate dehydrogenase 1B [Dreissena polymorpha]|uniref:Lactate/malate dehydrogenase C-terminal domain-containing protein n=1 Tax=Dreissena polymorpha TaxID=45954 RepID=A0A9D4BLR9_DREPO|nr:putative malate dehydrogenase 1B [Dreissena polymorpha]KAH3699556.1 hypothetical protein DPMN_074514 [Dreissena polymorpha]